LTQEAGQGQPNGSRLDQVIWDEFSTDWQALAREAERIRSHVS
jgi:hypothetical protein